MKWESTLFKIIVAFLMLAALTIFVVIGIRNVSLGDKLEKMDAEIVDLEKKNEELQKEKDLAIEEKEKEIEELMEKDKEHMAKIEELEPKIEEADAENERLKKEREKMEEEGASCEEKLENADAQILVLTNEVTTLKTQKQEALDANKGLRDALLKKDGIIGDWETKYNSLLTAKEKIQDAYEKSKKQIRILKLKGTLGSFAGAAIGLAGGLLLGK